MKLVTTEAVMTVLCQHCDSHIEMCEECGMREIIESVPSAWISVKDRLPEEGGEYLVAYHPCYWDDVKTSVTRVGIDNFRGKTSWAKRKFQRVMHWLPLPDAPEVEG